MNYLHSFHAGNFADVLKHAVLCLILQHLRQKNTPFRVLDTHAGRGHYHLLSPEAARNPEWLDGIARLEQSPLFSASEALRPYREALLKAKENDDHAYPGSPWLIQHFLREQDRFLAYEKHPDEQQCLFELLRGDTRCKTFPLDGWQALKSTLPPPEKRGLVLIDPPFEAKNEWQTLQNAVLGATKRWPNGIFLIWYPIKDEQAAQTFQQSLGSPDAERLLHISLTNSHAQTGLKTTGISVINPPWGLQQHLPELTKLLLETFTAKPNH